MQARAFLVIFLLSCANHGFWLTKVPERHILPHTRWESEAIAVSLATTGTFADPYVLPTGPTAHLPPIPPAINGLIYRVFGLNLTAGYLAWSWIIVISAVLWGLLPWLAVRLGLPVQAGVTAGLVGALLPRWPGHGEGLAALAIGLLMAAFLHRWRTGDTTADRSILLGMAVGLTLHVQPAVLTVALGWLVFELRWLRTRGQIRYTALLAVGMVLACVPWGVRNYRAFDAVFFIRSNLGLELRMGNHPGAAAAMEVMDRDQEHLHPRTHEGEARKVQEMGEIAYMRQAGHEALDWIRNYPATFLRLTGSRVAHWWLGPLHDRSMTLAFATLTLLALIGAWRIVPRLDPPQRAVLLIPLLAYPAVYYLVAFMPRYRQPVDWIFYLLAGAAVWSRVGKPRNGSGPP